MKWCRMAADEGCAPAQCSIGYHYFIALPEDKDAAEAVKWFRKAAEQGYAEAEHMLGVCYIGGEGVPKDYVEGYKWENISAASGNQLARDNLEKIEKVMTPQQIAEAQKLSREWKPMRR
jgi:TPR repeat protein